MAFAERLKPLKSMRDSLFFGWTYAENVEEDKRNNSSGPNLLASCQARGCWTTRKVSFAAIFFLLLPGGTGQKRPKKLSSLFRICSRGLLWGKGSQETFSRSLWCHGFDFWLVQVDDTDSNARCTHCQWLCLFFSECRTSLYRAWQELLVCGLAVRVTCLVGLGAKCHRLWRSKRPVFLVGKEIFTRAKD